MSLSAFEVMGADEYRAFTQRLFAARAGRGLNALNAQAFQQRADTSLNSLNQRADAHVGVPSPQFEPPGGFDIGRIPVLGGALTGAGSFLSGALDLLGRPSQALAGSIIAGQEGRNPLQGVLTGIIGTESERRDLNFATVLENMGWEHEASRNVVGMALTMVTDPLNLIPLLGGTKFLRRGFEAASLIAQRTPVIGTVIDAFSPHIGHMSHAQLRRELGKETADILIREERTWRAMRRGAAERSGVRDAVDAIGDVPLAERQRAMRLMVQHHGTPWEDALQAANNQGERTVINFFKSRFDSEIGDIALMADDLLDIRPVIGTYAHVLYFDKQSGRAFDNLVTQITHGKTGKKFERKRTPEEIISDPEFVDDALVVAAFDIGHVQLQAARSRLISPTILRGMGFRKLGKKKGEVDVADIDLDEATILAAKGSTKKRVGVDDYDLDTEDLFRPNGPRSRFMTTSEVNTLGKKVTKTFKLDEEVWVGPKAAVKALNTMEQPFQMAGILSMVDTVGAMWKPSVTIIWPAFHVRNFISNIFLGAQAGMYNPIWYKRAIEVQNGAGMSVKLSEKGIARRFGKERPMPGGGDLKLTNVELLEAFEQGGLINVGTRSIRTSEELPSNWFGRATAKVLGQRAPREVTEKMRQLEGVQLALDDYGRSLVARNSVAGSPFPNILRWGRTFSEGTDNNAKIGMAMWRLASGDTMQEAIDFTIKALPAYAEYGTSATFRRGRAIIPFLSWTRFNVPRQIEMLVTRPEIASKFGLLQPATTVSAMLDAEKAMLPDWLLERHNVLLGKNDDGTVQVLYGLGLPIEDLNKLFASFKGRGEEPGLGAAALGVGGTVENWLGDVAPYLRFWFENAFDKSAFTGERIKDPAISNYYRRAWNFTSEIPGLRDFLEIQPRKLRDGRTFYVADPFKMYLLGTFFGRFASTGDRIGDAFETRDALIALNVGSGIKVGRIFPKQPDEVPFGARLAQDPQLSALYDEYKQIPVFVGFSAAQSNRIIRVQYSARKHRRSVKVRFPNITDTNVLWDIAYRAVEHASGDAEAVAWARMIRIGGIDSPGFAARQRFLQTQPRGFDLSTAINEVNPGFLDDMFASE
jgi:hypothetical protein